MRFSVSISELSFTNSRRSKMNCKDCKWNKGSIDEEGAFIDCVWVGTEEDPVPPCSSEEN